MPNSFLPVWTRRLHRWGTVIVAVPFLIILVTGLLLLWKKDVAWIQPPTRQGTGTTPTLTFDEILDVARRVPEAGIQSWADVDRLDVRPDRGVVKVRAANRWEIQVDLQTGEVLQTAYRRSDLIEALHDGSWFHDHVKRWVFFPVALVVLGLYLTGLYLFYLPYRRRRRTGSASGGSARPDSRPPPGTRPAVLPETR
ncbi:MAG: PepSY domain-containing protein [Bacteroidetes bacterium]|nr:MAG: PepSY domain-containing protein [Bacteroidota bacterium]